jgi:hypothetical protein
MENRVVVKSSICVVVESAELQDLLGEVFQKRLGGQCGSGSKGFREWEGDLRRCGCGMEWSICLND